jgi:hypothetical protein
MATPSPAGQYFTPAIPEQNKFQNLDLNAVGSPYAWMYGHGTTDLV